MTFKEIQDLIKLIDKSTLTEFSYKTGDYEIKIKGQQEVGQTIYNAPSSVPSYATQQVISTPAQAPIAAEQSTKEAPQSTPASNLIEVKSPMVGTFYRAPGPDKSPFVNVGDSIGKGSVVCVIEAMKLFNEIESEYSGKIVKVMVEDASPVEYDQVLFLIEP
jgi:acetyl-CoA carboxylase biotin carboxyl carrier protein